MPEFLTSSFRHQAQIRARHFLLFSAGFGFLVGLTNLLLAYFPDRSFLSAVSSLVLSCLFWVWSAWLVRFKNRFRFFALFLVCLFPFLIYLPDSFVVFAREIGWVWSPIICLGLWIGFACVMLPLRLPLLFLSARSRMLYALGVPYLELSFLIWLPTSYFGSFPPVFSADPRQGGGLEQAGEGDVAVVLVDPRWSRVERESLQKLGLQSSVWIDFFARVDALILGFREWPERIDFVFPETSFPADPLFLRHVYSLLSERLPGSALRLMVGVGHGRDNRVLLISDSGFGRPRISELARKQVSVPFFEKEVFGLSIWSANGTDVGQKLGFVPKAILEIAGSPFEVLICYEALFWKPWEKNKEAQVVFTNHHLFSAFGILSKSYDRILRLVARLENRGMVLVANQGENGAFAALSRFLPQGVEFMTLPRPGKLN